ncbi:TolB family protein [Candidatus Bipolaricaulota bacterium]
MVIYREVEVRSRGEIAYTIYAHDLHSAESRVVYQGVDEDVYPPWISQDGRTLLIRREGGFAPASLGDPERVMPLSANQEGVAYSDGGRVWYHRFDQATSYEVSRGREACGGEALSPCGRYVAYVSGDTNGIIIADLLTGREADVGEGSSVAWSPDGKHLLYQVTRDDGHYITGSDLFVIQPDGRNRQQLTFDPRIVYHNPAWSPNGLFIVCDDLHP